MINFGDPNIDYEELEGSKGKKKPKKKKKKSSSGEETETEDEKEEEKPKHEDDPLSVDANAEEEDPKKAKEKMKKKKAAAHGANANANTNVKGRAGGLNSGIKGKKDGQMREEETVDDRGELESYEYRYFCRQNDSIVLAMAMVAEHCDIALRERTIASRWVDSWDDCTPSYNYLRIKARSLSDV